MVVPYQIIPETILRRESQIPPRNGAVENIARHQAYARREAVTRFDRVASSSVPRLRVGKGYRDEL